ncbi:LysE family transporter [Comamonas sp. J-3]|uniref:LysE family transporter n=1 Tax=Comamonas trifloxystrobinivorans TaxID=3350256 RepID=UPI0037280F80
MAAPRPAADRTTMSYALSLLTIAGIYLAILASPGPNFFILSQMALQDRKQEARAVVYGLTTGSVFWVVLALAGLSTLLAQHPWLSTTLRVLGAAYLVWYGAHLLRSAFQPAAATGGTEPNAPPAQHLSTSSAYRTGLLTGMTNPKGAAFWTSAFAALFPAQAPLWFYVATVVLVTSMSLGWHLGITLVFGNAAMRRGYLRIERSVNGVAGGALVLLGIQRMVSR